MCGGCSRAWTNDPNDTGVEKMEQQAPQAVPVAPVDSGQALDQMTGAMATTGPGIGATAHDLSVYGLFIQADWIVKAVMIMLLLASIWRWAIHIHQLIR